MRRLSGNCTTIASPESAHSLRVPRGSASSRLSGMVLMAMEFLTFHNEFIPDLAAENEQNHFFTFDIIQRAEIAGAEFEFDERIGPQSLNRTGWLGGLLCKPRQDG